MSRAVTIGLLVFQCVLFLKLVPAVQSQTITWLGRLNYISSRGTAVSGDGQVVCGWLEGSGDSSMPFRWTAAKGIEPLGTMGRRGGQTKNISTDGSTIVGHLTRPYNRAFKWTEKAGMIAYDTPLGCSSFASCVTADGSIVAGGKAFEEPRVQACLWFDNGTTRIIDSNEVSKSIVGVSDDGQVMVANYSFAGDHDGILWVGDSAWKFLARIPGARYNTPTGISRDGKNIVGSCTVDIGLEHILHPYWIDSNRVIHDLGNLGGKESIAYSVSSGKPIVVGNSNNRAFIWTQESQMRDMNKVFASLLKDNSVLSEALFISADGRFIVGSGHNRTNNDYEGFLIDRKDTSSVINTIDNSTTQKPVFVVSTIPDNISLYCQQPISGNLQFTLYNLYGCQVLQHNIDESAFNSYHHIPVPSLASAVYLYRIQTPESVECGSVVVVE